MDQPEELSYLYRKTEQKKKGGSTRDFISRTVSSAMAEIIDRELSGKDEHAGQHDQTDNP
jgi:hypothetical protein